MTEICEWAFLDGGIQRAERLSISPFDRGFLFAHAAYEVTAVYNGALIDWDGHATRLARTLDGLEIPNPLTGEGWRDLHERLIERNALAEGLIYLQVSGGDYGFRDFVGPDVFEPTVFMFATAKKLIGPTARDGLKAITLPDQRWKRRDWKTTQLLSQTQAYRAAKRAGADAALMHEDGAITEAASANAWIVTTENALVTRDLSHALLPGITRRSVLDLARAAGLTVEERPFTVDQAKAAQEAFTTSTGAIIAPIIEIDGEPVGDGRPGPMTRRVQQLYYQAIGADLAADAPWILA